VVGKGYNSPDPKAGLPDVWRTLAAPFLFPISPVDDWTAAVPPDSAGITAAKFQPRRKNLVSLLERDQPGGRGIVGTRIAMAINRDRKARRS